MARVAEEGEVLLEQVARVQKLPTLPAAILQVVLCIAQIVLVFLLPALYREGEHSSLSSFSLLIYSHSAHCAAFFAIDQYLQLHHRRSRRQGYLAFYLRTKSLRRAPFHILSAGSAVLVLVIVILHDTAGPCLPAGARVDYLRGLVTLESLVVLCLVTSYIHLLAGFHAACRPPDVLRGDLYPALPDARELVGSREPGQLDVVMERQAEMIRYLTERCDQLCGKVQQVTALLGSKERRDTYT